MAATDSLYGRISQTIHLEPGDLLSVQAVVSLAPGPSTTVVTYFLQPSGLISWQPTVPGDSNAADAAALNAVGLGTRGPPSDGSDSIDRMIAGWHRFVRRVQRGTCKGVLATMR